MHYVISDIHGCYEEYIKLLDEIHFSDDDILYVLGDVVDRGPEPVKVLLDMMARPNVIPILGNHEYMALETLKQLAVEITEENAEQHLNYCMMRGYMNWMENGGGTTAAGFRKLDADMKEAVLDYLEEFAAYEVAEAGGEIYVLVHAGIEGFRPGKPLDTYDFSDFIFYGPDYSQRYFLEGVTMVVGHTPVMNFYEDGRCEVYSRNGILCIDGGCVFGGRLFALRLEDKKVFAVSSGAERIDETLSQGV